MQDKTAKTKVLDEKEITTRDSIKAGICRALGLEVIPKYDSEQVSFGLLGDVNVVLQKIADNAPVGSRDVFEAIKNCRSAIWLFKHGGKK
jgi:hypothetical protein